jgi:hypothetical protein
MERSPLEAKNGVSARPEIPCHLSPYRVHSSPHLDPILSQMNPVNTFTTCMF